jgi:hypothetical protein
VTARPGRALQQSTPFGMEMRDEYKLVHTGVDMTVRLMEDVAAGRNHPSALEKDPVSCALMSDL